MARDGSIILETDIDTKGITTKMRSIQSVTSQINSKFGSMGAAISSAMSQGDAKTASAIQRFQKLSTELDTNIAKLAEMQRQLQIMELGQKANAVNAAINIGELNGVSPEKLDALRAEFALLEMQAANLGITLKEAMSEAVRGDADKLRSEIEKTDQKVKDLSNSAEIAGGKLQLMSTSSTPQISDLTKGIEKFGNRISGLVKRVFIFSLITKLLRGLRTTIGNLLAQNTGFQNSLNSLYSALYTAFAPIYSYVVPALQALINWIAAGINALTKFIATVTGKSYSAWAAQGQALKKQSDGYKAVGGGAGKAAKGMKKVTDEAKKQLAAFDELNILTEDKTESDTGGADAGGTGGAVGGGEVGNFDISPISQKLAMLGEIVGASLCAIGIILLFTGNFGWGIGFIIAGASIYAVAEQSYSENDPTETPKQKLANLVTLIGMSLSAIGIILIFFGKIPIGIGALAAGITAMGIAAQDVSESSIAGKIKKFMEDNEKEITGISTAFLVLGIILLLSGVFSPLSIGLIAIGAVGLATELALEEGNVMEKINKFITDNSNLFIGVSLALLVLGVILLLAGLISPLSIGLVAIGAVGLATELALEGNNVKSAISTFLEDNAGLIIGISSALLVLGIILICCGVITPLTIGLLAAGGVGLATTITANWGAIKEKVNEVWEGIKTWWNEKVSKYFTAEWWGNLGKKAIEGLVNKIIDGLNTLAGKLNSFGFDLPEVLGGAHIGFNIGKIPHIALAEGGIVPHATNALIGEAGKEAVLPLENNTEWMDMLADRIFARANLSSNNSTVILEVDGREFGRAVVNLGKQENRRIGTRLVTV